MMAVPPLTDTEAPNQSATAPSLAVSSACCVDERIDPQGVPRPSVVDPQPDDAAGDLDPRASLHTVGVERGQVRIPSHRDAARIAESHPRAVFHQRRCQVSLDRHLDREDLAASTYLRRGEEEPLLHAERSVDVLLLAPVRAPMGGTVLDHLGVAVRLHHGDELRASPEPRPPQPHAIGFSDDLERPARQRDIEPMRVVAASRASRGSALEAVCFAAVALPSCDEARPERRGHPPSARGRSPRRHGPRREVRRRTRVHAARRQQGGHDEAEHQARRPSRPHPLPGT
jgi:hypothetical protein